MREKKLLFTLFLLSKWFFLVSLVPMLWEKLNNSCLEFQCCLKNKSKLRKQNLTRLDFEFLKKKFEMFWVDELICRYANDVTWKLDFLRKKYYLNF